MYTHVHHAVEHLSHGFMHSSTLPWRQEALDESERRNYLACGGTNVSGKFQENCSAREPVEIGEIILAELRVEVGVAGGLTLA